MQNPINAFQFGKKMSFLFKKRLSQLKHIVYSVNDPLDVWCQSGQEFRWYIHLRFTQKVGSEAT